MKLSSHSQMPPKCEDRHANISSQQNGLVIVSAIMLGLGMLPGNESLRCLWLIQSTLVTALLILPTAWRAAASQNFDMNVLVTVTVPGAWIIGEGHWAAMIGSAFSLSTSLESFSTDGIRRAIVSLAKLAPDTEFLRTCVNQFKETTVTEVAIGNEIRICSGTCISMDGVVVKGSSEVNLAPITGDPIPIRKQIGDAVFAGSINGNGLMLVKVTNSASDSALARVIRLVGQNSDNKASHQLLDATSLASTHPSRFSLRLWQQFYRRC
ncbi:cation-translocating P-type ATPase [Brevifollis gellanilyticus]|uniref:P-type ATPase n=1 Tax=Brevifollis gellanilyticus TaxID=748831 RepID=UPI0011BECB88|nr:cation-translocating P-type ATPase [Brevifollis gellanilyticus]